MVLSLPNDDARKALKSPWIRSTVPSSSRKIARYYVCCFRLTILLLLFVYVPIALYYLSSTNGPSNSPKHESPKSILQARQIPKNDHSIRNIVDSSIDYDSQEGMHVANNFVYQQLRIAGVTEQRLEQLKSSLPKWDDIVQQFGAKPIIHNLASCPTYQALVPAQNRVLGAAGMFNTGTNLVTQLLKQNCYIPQRATLYGTHASKEQLGVRWQVPWGKHTPAHYKYLHAASDKAATIDTQDVLPIVTIRHPYRWIQSMCHHPYSAKWDHFSQCPNLLAKQVNRTKSVNASPYNPVTVKYGAGTETYASIPHLWNDWYNEYYRHSKQQKSTIDLKENSSRKNTTNNHDNDEESSYPLLIVRIEDLIFHTKDTITSICHCAGGELYDHNFTYIVTSAKGDSPGHDTTTDLAIAYIKYGTPIQTGAGFESTDYTITKAVLDNKLMNVFHYLHPT